jgi:RNA-directed DNA polymerase
VSLGSVRRQKTARAVRPKQDRGEAPKAERRGETLTAASGDERSGNGDLMQLVVERSNMREALRRVRGNKGSPGIDGMTVDELPAYLVANWRAVREQLLAGTYQPQPVLRRQIPKSGGGMRELGIPTVLDRLIQQAILQVLQPRLDPGFSEYSYGFRPGRSAHDAVRAAQKYIQEGRRWVVDVDLEKFFDRVNHDVLMGRLARRVSDKQVLGLIRRYLQAGIMADGVVVARDEGTPQGGPLSPLLANVLLDEVDKELEKRGHAFARYADDCNIYVRSRRAGERVMEALRRLYAGLRLRVNEAKSAVARPRDRKFLGFTFWDAKGKVVRRRVAPAALAKMKERVRELTGRNRGRSMEQVAETLAMYLRGWKEYFKLAETPKVFADLDRWIRHRVRVVQLKHWRNGSTVFRELRARGVPVSDAVKVARNTRRWTRNAGMLLLHILRTDYFDALGIPRLAADLNRPNRPVRTRMPGGVGGVRRG